MNFDNHHDSTYRPLVEKPRGWVRWLVGFLVCALMGVHLVVLALQRLDGVPVWLAEMTRFVPYYWLLLPSLAALVIALTLSRLWLALAVGNLLMLCTLTMGLQWNGSGDVGFHGTRVRVLTYNVKAFQAVHHLGGLDAIAQEIRLWQPDIVALQDADGWVVSRSETAVTEAAPMFGLSHVMAMGQYVVASRFPLSGCESGQINFRDESHRSLRCQVNVNGKPVQLVTAHFVSPRAALTATRRNPLQGVREWKQNLIDRLNQSRALLADISKAPRPLLVMGDLNAPEGSPVVAGLKLAGLRDAFSAAGHGYGYSHGHSLARGLDITRIDHILVSADVGVVHSEVGGGEASEHNPVIADLVLP
jgi:endonuclease/exonuclease/phosphatase family metal-dependent hydrolase